MTPQEIGERLLGQMEAIRSLPISDAEPGTWKPDAKFSDVVDWMSAMGSVDLSANGGRT